MAVMGHEITHMFGVRHCVFNKCLMNGSNHLEESNKKPFHLCIVCLRKMQSNIKFDILERYLRLRDFFCSQKDERVNKEI
jgi:archaemetzincin